MNEFTAKQYKDLESIFKNDEMWTNYMLGINKYQWWASQEVNDSQKVHAYLFQKIKTVKKLITLSK